ncbi:GGDEF domain-containing phosphodiesterase [Aquisalimonas lutea]|uniref:putative bifunctional diguanylate cyclase/phosphodiesterase n=1 Tax=Aquisalimonas lutea TaxID=1327750 RepID=UPI0025B484BC|nr:GGDEF domain-containing phosphodiesterase [Aquisalimonas lutea]MDN3518184.1 GGDEF domain-containing phosphodiesterase [Aquisalimonas lutea]
MTRKRVTSFLLIALGLAVAVVLVVRDGGTPSAYAHFAYAPVALAAFRFRGLGGFVTGLLGGAAVGPVAELVVSGTMLTVPAQYVSWSVRASWMAVIGVTLGHLFEHARRQAGILDWYRFTDRGTELPNLVGVRRQLALRLEEAPGVERIVVVVKITNYDHLLATFGYEGSDQVVRGLGQQLRVKLPAEAIVGRTGNDELVVVEPVGPEIATTQLPPVLRELTGSSLYGGHIHAYVETALGVMRMRADAVDSEAPFVQAAVAAARAHEEGAGVAYYEEEREQVRRDGIHLLSELPGALEREEIVLVYQPKLCLQTGRFVGVEALARWQHPVRGWLAPGAFIPLVEQTGMIGALTAHVLERAIRQTRLWHDQGLAVSVSVNISTRNLTSGSLLQHITDLLEETGLAPEALELEITETALMDVYRAHLDQLARLREQGVRVAIDDFGTGYASLAYVRDLPLDTLKLDKSFIRSAPEQRRERQILRRMIDMAKDLDLQVVGEGVEDAETLALLMELGVDQAQGYHMAYPLAADDVRPLLLQSWSGSGPAQRISPST